jgi:hypothetical protein
MASSVSLHVVEMRGTNFRNGALFCPPHLVACRYPFSCWRRNRTLLKDQNVVAFGPQASSSFAAHVLLLCWQTGTIPKAIAPTYQTANGRRESGSFVQLHSG